MKKYYVSLLVILISLIISCKNDSEYILIKSVQKVEKRERKLFIASSEEPISINPNIAYSSTAILVNSLTSEGLTKINKDGEMVPALAERWEVSEDGKKWTFYLRDNLKWSNGDNITANDFKFSWVNVLNPSTNAKNAKLMYIIKGAEEYNKSKGKLADLGIKVINSKVLEVELKEPALYFPVLLSHIVFSPISEKFYNGSKEDFGLRPETIVASGPYILREWNPRNNLVLVKNEYYWDKEMIKLKALEIKLIPEFSKALAAFYNNSIDMVFLDPNQLETYSIDNRKKKFQDGKIFFLTFNTKNKIFENKNIRKALQMSLDKNELKEVLGDKGIPVQSIIPEKLKGYENSYRAEAGNLIPEYNPRKSKKLYKEGLKELNLEKLPKIELQINESFMNRKIAEYVQKQLKENLEIDVEITSDSREGFEIKLTSWKADYADFKPYLDLFVTNGKNNFGFYSNKDYDKIVREADIAMNNKKRTELVEEAEKLIMEDPPAVFLYSQVRNVLVDSDIQKVYFRAFGPEYYLYETEILELKGE